MMMDDDSVFARMIVLPLKATFFCTDRWSVSNLNLGYCRAEKRNRGLWHSISFRDLFRSIVGQSFQVNRLKITGHDRFLRYLKFVKSTGPPIQSKNTQPQGNLPSFKVNFIYIKMQYRCMKMLIRNGITTLHSEQETTEPATQRSVSIPQL